MLTAISQRHVKLEKGNRDALENSYVKYYEKFGLSLVLIPNTSSKTDDYFDKMKIERIILTGGDDVNPKLYGAKGTGIYSGERDKTEIKLIDMAIKRKIPLLATCRGTQILNVYFKGRLLQNLKENGKENHVGSRHDVRIVDNNVKKFYGKNSFIVNSYHNHGITMETLSKNLRPFAVSDDGIVEGIYHPKYPIAGIIWHPERDGSDKKMDKKLVDAFVEGSLFWKR